jgi:2-polyprenyl-3-methyl-5-hydroxy-6-metoxy-1,4-benzoquinol methylase
VAAPRAPGELGRRTDNLGGSSAAAAHCLVCGASSLKKLHRTENQDLLRCRECGLVFGWPVFARTSLLTYNELSFRGEGFPEMAEFFGRGSRAMIRQYQRGLKQIARVVPSGRLLDVGCGVPVFLDLARSAGYEVRGVDSVPEVSRIGQDEFGLRIENASFDQCGLDGASFDVITMWDFLEHVPDPMAALRLSRYLLRPGGVLFICLPNYRSVLHAVATLLAKVPTQPVRLSLEKLYHYSHVCVWSPRALEKALALSGFLLVRQGMESPVLNRYRLSLATRFGLTVIDVIARVTALRSRLWVVSVSEAESSRS